MHTQKIEINGEIIACLLSDIKSGNALVFLHGAGSTNREWQDQWAYFKDQMTVVVPDLPGHGDSPGNGCDSIDGYADIIVRLIKKLKLDGCVLIGHSMGGAIAQKIALLQPDLLSGLVLAATGARLRVSSQIFSTIKTNFEQYIDLASLSSLPETADTQKKNAFRDTLSHCIPSIVYNDFEACNKFDVMNEIAHICIRTLIINGDRDIMTPVKYAQYLHKKIANSHLFIVPDAGHMAAMERPEEVNKAISDFLASGS